MRKINWIKLATWRLVKRNGEDGVAGETDLAKLLRTMRPVLADTPYGFAIWTGGALPLVPFATVAEDEGLTVIAPLAAIVAAGMISDPWARISLSVYSDLAAVGLTAAFAGTLATAGISANLIAGYHHDHIFVQWDRRTEALAASTDLSNV
jgi:uncharacterized protein